MNKSIAETVDFGNAVQTKAYEKAAQKVDTFVQSETAEQKLARSGKMQTAKALDSLAKLGGSVVQYQEKQAVQNAEKIRENLSTYVAQALEEVRTGKIDKWTDSQIVSNMPVALHMEMAKSMGKRQYIAAQTAFSEELAANPEIQLKDDEYQDLIDKHFGYEAADSPLDVLSQTTFNNSKDEFFAKQRVDRATYQRADRIERLEEDAALNVDQYFELGRTQNDYTTIEKDANGDDKFVVSKDWDKVSSIDSSGNRVFDPAKWATLVSENILKNDAADLGKSGLTPKQYKPIIQKAYLDVATALDMPELLESVPTLYRSSEFNDKIITLNEQRQASEFQKWQQNQAITKAARVQQEIDASNWAYEQSQDGSQLVDVMEAGKLSQQHYNAAVDLNNKINKTVTRKQSLANAKKLASNIDQAIVNGTPLVGTDGKPVLDPNGDPIDVNDPNAVRAYVMSLPNIWIDDSNELIEGMDDLFSAANLVENQYLIDGLERVDELTTTTGSQFRLFGDNQDVKDKFEELFIENWKITQQNNPKVNLKLKKDLQKQVMKDTLAEWKELPQWDRDNVDAFKTAYEHEGGQTNRSKNKHPNTKNKTGIKMNDKQKEFYFKNLATSTDPEAFKQLHIDKGYILPEE